MTKQENAESKKQPTDLMTRPVEYTPLGESSPIKISLGMLKKRIVNTAKNEVPPSENDLMAFQMLCLTKRLNPWAGDAYLLGYNDGPNSATYTQITAIQAIHKRAELNPNYDGLESGIVVLRGDDELELVGSITRTGDQLVGGWAKFYRKDRSIPFYVRVALKVYDQKRSRWKVDPAGMIQKVAEAATGRRAFPTEVGGLYCREEMDKVVEQAPATEIKKAGVDALLERVTTPKPENPEAEKVRLEGMGGHEADSIVVDEMVTPQKVPIACEPEPASETVDNPAEREEMTEREKEIDAEIPDFGVTQEPKPTNQGNMFGSSVNWD